MQSTKKTQSVLQSQLAKVGGEKCIYCCRRSQSPKLALHPQAAVRRDAERKQWEQSKDASEPSHRVSEFSQLKGGPTLRRNITGGNVKTGCFSSTMKGEHRPGKWYEGSTMCWTAESYYLVSSPHSPQGGKQNSGGPRSPSNLLTATFCTYCSKASPGPQNSKIRPPISHKQLLMG